LCFVLLEGAGYGSAASQQLKKAASIKQVMTGGGVMSPNIARKVIDFFEQTGHDGRRAD
jgi:hypothetical protein